MLSGIGPINAIAMLIAPLRRGGEGGPGEGLLSRPALGLMPGVAALALPWVRKRLRPPIPVEVGEAD